MGGLQALERRVEARAERLFRFLSTNPYVAVVSGLCIAGQAGYDLLNMPGSGGISALFNAHSGLALLGIHHVAFGVTYLVAGTRLTGFGLITMETRERDTLFDHALHRFVNSPYLGFVLAFMTLLMVVMQTHQEWIAGDATGPRSVWYFGLGLMTLLAIAKSLEMILIGLRMMDDSEKAGHFRYHLAGFIDRYVRNPWLLIMVALICLLLGGMEETLFAATDPGERHILSHYGLLILVSLEVVKMIPMVFFGSWLAEEGLSAEINKESLSANTHLGDR